MHPAIRALIGLVCLETAGAGFFVVFNNIRRVGMNATMHVAKDEHAALIFGGLYLLLTIVGMWALLSSKSMNAKVEKAAKKIEHDVEVHEK